MLDSEVIPAGKDSDDINRAFRSVSTLSYFKQRKDRTNEEKLTNRHSEL